MVDVRTDDAIDTADRGDRPDDAELPAGTIIGGKYCVERTLGAGGMGVVVVASPVAGGERVAIKVLRAEALKKKDVVARFEREARAIAKLGGDHVARIVDFGTLESGAQYIAMEYLEGTDLARLLRERGPLGVAEAVDYVTQACEALAEVHAAGIVHRDLKPGNLFLTRTEEGEPLVKLLDFGIAKTAGSDAKGEGEVTLTNTESFLGSPVYMSPEQMMAPKKVDSRTDIWALGVTLYRLLSRKVPFDGGTSMEICGLIMLGARPASLRELGIDVPSAIDDAILKCLSREPGERFRNVAELADALAPFGTPAAAASAKRARKRLEGVEGAWATQSSPMLPRVERPPVLPDDVETLAAGTLSTLARRSSSQAPALGRRWVLPIVALSLVAAGVVVFRTIRPTAAVAPEPAAAAATPAVAVSAQVDAPVASAPAPVATSAASGSHTPPSATAVSGGPPAARPVRSAASKPDPAGAPSAAPQPPPSATSLPGGVFGGRPF